MWFTSHNERNKYFQRKNMARRPASITVNLTLFRKFVNNGNNAAATKMLRKLNALQNNMTPNQLNSFRGTRNRHHARLQKIRRSK